MNTFFVGIGGMGMSGLAKILHTAGFTVAGSDRNLQGDYCQRLRDMGIKIYPQDGTGPRQFLEDNGFANTDVILVKSTAVEDHVPDIVAAQDLGLTQIMRSDLLANMFNQQEGIAVGGTAGKTTTSGLIAWMLKYVGMEPSCAIGGIISGLNTNAMKGNGPHFVIEADESDGSIVKYRPHISLLTNISRDHKSLDELGELFLTFLNNTDQTGTRILCGEDPHIQGLIPKIEGPIVTYGRSPEYTIHPAQVEINSKTINFVVDDIEFSLSLRGEHNLLNALGAIAVAKSIGIPMIEASTAIKAFQGMKRRFEHVGTTNGVTVIDDFAHNPAEISAAIATARHTSQRRFIVYQPHGYGPARFTRKDLVSVFGALQSDEYLYLDDIYYGGGTVEKDISSEDIVNDVRKSFPNAYYMGTRQEIVTSIAQEAKEGDMVLVMGARDINNICQDILALIP